MAATKTFPKEPQIVSRVVSKVRESERLVKRKPGVALPFRQDKILVERRPLRVKVVPSGAISVYAVAQ